jgi:hypothetical protein
MRAITLTAAAAAALCFVAEPGLVSARGFGGGFHGFGGGGFHGGFGGGGFHGFGGGGGFHGFGGGHGFDGFHGNSSWSHTAAGGVAHTSDVGGFEHGTAVGPNGVAHASDSGGFVHGTAASGGEVAHTGAYGTSYGDRGYGGYYAQPAALGWYGANGCWSCGVDGWGNWGDGWGGAAAGAAIGAAAATAANNAAGSYNDNAAAIYNAGVAAGAAAAPGPVGKTYAALPAGCAFAKRGQYPYYYCAGATPYWLAPAYGANGVYFQVVPTPVA